jgi:hypothetical protein
VIFPRLPLLILLLAAPGLSPRGADPRRIAESEFLRQINSMDGIETSGGPFKAGEHHDFGEESGYFIVAPEIARPELNQQVTVQTRVLEGPLKPGPHLDKVTLASRPFPAELALPVEARINLLRALAAQGLGEPKDEVTIFDTPSVSTRPVLFLPIIAIHSSSNGCASGTVLLGSQSWGGIPLIKVSYSRARGGFDLNWFGEGYATRPSSELKFRAMPLIAPQTFYADPGLAARDWQKLLLEFGRLEELPAEIVDAQVSDDYVTLAADYQEAQLPAFCAGVRMNGTRCTVEWLVELRAEFPRPAHWWSFFPLREKPASAEVTATSEAACKTGSLEDRLALTELLLRLRGIDTPLSLVIAGNSAQAKTSATKHFGYNLHFEKVSGTWRLGSVAEWYSDAQKF